MNQEKIAELEKLINDVIDSYTKADAKRSLTPLKFLAAQIKPQISAYGAEKLSNAVGYAESADGQVKNKEHWSNNAKQSWYLFERELSYSED